MMLSSQTVSLLFALVVLLHGTSAQDVLTAKEANAFVNAQFSHYFTDCSEFVKTFAKDFQYCDFAQNKPEVDCLTSQEDLLTACSITQGAPTIIYQLEPKPIYTGIISSYNEIAIKGFQKVHGVPYPNPETGDVTVVDMCFDLVIVENLQRSESSELGIESTFWKGYFSVELCGIPGLPPCSCDSMEPLASYNMAPTCTDCGAPVDSPQGTEEA